MSSVASEPSRSQVINCQPHCFTTEEISAEPYTGFCMIGPAQLFSKLNKPSIVSPSPYRSPSPQPVCAECCWIMFGVARKGPKILC